jgi:hypothetical protein
VILEEYPVSRAFSAEKGSFTEKIEHLLIERCRIYDSSSTSISTAWRVSIFSTC